MAKYKIIYNRKDCIGAFACSAVAPDFWGMKDDGKVDLIGGQINKETGFWELTIDEEDYPKILESAEACPVKVIKIEKIS